MVKGKEEGMEKGKEEGIVKGREEGMKEKEIEIAKKMLSDNMPLEIICKYSNLSKEEVERLRKKSPQH